MTLLFNPLTYKEAKPRPHSAESVVRALGSKDRAILAMHLNGQSTSEICEALAISRTRVYAVLTHPQTREIMERELELLDKEFASLYPRAVEAIKLSLQSDDAAVRLKAAERVLRFVGREEPEKGQQVSAEDLIQRLLLEVKSDGPVHLRLATQTQQALPGTSGATSKELSHDADPDQPSERQRNTVCDAESLTFNQEPFEDGAPVGNLRRSDGEVTGEPGLD